MIGSLLDSLRDARRRKAWPPAQAAGRRAEDLAHRYLHRQGYTIVARNYRLPSGSAEADLIAWDKDKLVIVEVKARETADYGPPERAISAEKRGAMLRVAREYAGKTDTPAERVRFDVVTVLLSDPPEITLHRGLSAAS